MLTETLKSFEVANAALLEKDRAFHTRKGDWKIS